MKLPGLNLQDVEARLDQAEANMLELVERLENIETLLASLVEIQQEALDRLPPR